MNFSPLPMLFQHSHWCSLSKKVNLLCFGAVCLLPFPGPGESLGLDLYMPPQDAGERQDDVICLVIRESRTRPSFAPNNWVFGRSKIWSL